MRLPFFVPFKHLGNERSGEMSIKRLRYVYQENGNSFPSFFSSPSSHRFYFPVRGIGKSDSDRNSDYALFADPRYARNARGAARSVSLVMLNLPLVLFVLLLSMTLGMVLISYAPRKLPDCEGVSGEPGLWPDFVLFKVVADG